LKGKLFKGSKKITGLEFSKGRGKGWTLQGKKINGHELDAYLVHYLGGKDD
jgi:hypothetical protein